MKEIYLLRNENGSVAVIALILLMLLTVIGISVSTTSTIELQIAGNEKFHKENLYLAEAAALEYAQQMEENLADDNDILNLDYSLNVRDETEWTNNSIDSTVNPYAKCIPKDEGIAPGASLDMTKPTVHQYGIYARCKRKNGLSIVRVGYRKAF